MKVVENLDSGIVYAEREETSHKPGQRESPGEDGWLVVEGRAEAVDAEAAKAEAESKAGARPLLGHPVGKGRVSHVGVHGIGFRVGGQQWV